MQNKPNLISFLRACVGEILSGGSLYRRWVGSLSVVIAVGLAAYVYQLKNGLIVTGMSDQVSWGTYIANFTFLVGMAAAAVMLVIPAYIFHAKHAKHVVLIGEGLAVAACTMCMLFVVVDLGRPDRFWHLIPGLGILNWPKSMLAWDVIVLNGYLLLNLFIPMYFLYNKYLGRTPDVRNYFPWILLAIFWAVSIHTVTAFLYSANSGRVFWHTALLAPRFIASAFTAGPAFMIIAFHVIDRYTDFEVEKDAIRLLGVVTTVALQINLFMVGVELFTEFYSPTEHSVNAEYLFKGIGEQRALVPWIYTAIALNVTAVAIMMIHKLRENTPTLLAACAMMIVGVWIEKGMGFVVPGFIPNQLGEIFEYTPTLVEVAISLGIWAVGMLVFTLLAKPAIAVETGRLRSYDTEISDSGLEHH